MLDIKFVRENPEIVKENIRKKFQDAKLPLVDEVIALDKRNREIKQEVEELRAKRNKTSKMIGALMAQGKRDEAEAVKARKELVAQLSHDIKTPVTSIKAMAEVMELSAHNEEDLTTIRSINAKADQIDSLVSNLFHATLEELEHLEVNSGEVTSKEIEHFISEADYKKKVPEVSIEEVVVSADPLRLNQVINNVFSNSYKYADTEMTIGSCVENGVGGMRFLVIEIGDKGGGVPDAEIETIFGKYKRGSNAGEKDGAGLGLYISRYLMEKMGGEITAVNKDGGLTIVLRLRLL